MSRRPPRPRINAKTWIVLSASGALLSFAPLAPGGRCALLLVLTAVFASQGALTRFLRFLLLGIAPVALVAWLIQTISHRGQTTYASWQPTGWLHFTITAEGLAFGTQLALQILCFGASCAPVTLLTSPLTLRQALTDWKAPPRLTYLLVASLNAPRQLRHYTSLIQEAGRARGMADRTGPQKIWLAVRTAGALFNLLLLDHQTRGANLAARGIDRAGPRTFLSAQADSRLQAALRWALAATSLTLTTLSYTGTP